MQEIQRESWFLGAVVVVAVKEKAESVDLVIRQEPAGTTPKRLAKLLQFLEFSEETTGEEVEIFGQTTEEDEDYIVLYRRRQDNPAKTPQPHTREGENADVGQRFAQTDVTSGNRKVTFPSLLKSLSLPWPSQAIQVVLLPNIMTHAAASMCEKASCTDYLS